MVGLVRSRAPLQAEILILRHQLKVLRRKSPKRAAARSSGSPCRSRPCRSWLDRRRGRSVARRGRILVTSAKRRRLLDRFPGFRPLDEVPGCSAIRMPVWSLLFDAQKNSYLARAGVCGAFRGRSVSSGDRRLSPVREGIGATEKRGRTCVSRWLWPRA